MTSDELRVLRARFEVVTLARAMLRGELPLLEGVQQMLPYRWSTGVDEWDDDFLTFVGIESQEDHLPVGAARVHWSPAALARFDPDIRQAEECHRPAAFAACESLVRRFTAPVAPVLQRLDELPADSDLRWVPEPLAARSLSDREVVLPYPEVLYAIDHLEAAGCDLLGWEGWLRLADDRAGHSARHQGTSGVESLPRAEAFRFCRGTIEETQSEWVLNPERPQRSHADLYFCLTFSDCRGAGE